MSTTSDARDKLSLRQGILDHTASEGTSPIQDALKKRRIKSMTDKGIAPDQIDNGQPFQNQGQGDT